MDYIVFKYYFKALTSTENRLTLKKNNFMKLMYSLLGLSLLVVACQPKVDNGAKEKFEKNSQTVMANLKGYENENLDYSMYADNFVMIDTGFGTKDSLSLDDIKKEDKMMWRHYDCKLLDDPVVWLPGVNPETKEPDGSVRYYGDWLVTLPATDSTEARSGVIKYYEYFVFDDNGKIVEQAGYGDYGGLFAYLHGIGGDAGWGNNLPTENFKDGYYSDEDKD